MLLPAATGQEAEHKIGATPSLEALRKDLASDDPATVAWAAYLAGQNPRQELVPVLRRVLRDLHAESPKRARSWEVGRSVLDAMVLSGGTLPTKELAPWFEAHPTEGLILAAAEPKAHAGLLLTRAEKKDSDLYWVAAINSLLVERPAMMLPHLLASMHVQMHMHVSSDDSFASSYWSTSMTHGCGGGSRTEGFPPVVYYKLVVGLSSSKRLVVDGPKAVAYSRREYRSNTFGLGGSVHQVDRSDYALSCLRQLAKLPDADFDHTLLNSTCNRSLTFTDGDTLLRDIATERALLEVEYGKLMRGLLAKKLLSPQEAAEQKLSIGVTLNDIRDENDRAVALPKLPLRKALLR